MTTKVRYSRKENFSPKEQTKFSKLNEEMRDYSIKFLVWSDGAATWTLFVDVEVPVKSIFDTRKIYYCKLQTLLL